MAEQRQFASMYPNNISHERVMSRWGTNGEGTASNLNLTVSGNTIRLKIYTGLSEDKQKDNKSIDFQFGAQNAIDFMTIVEAMRSIAEMPLDAGSQKRAFAIRNYRHKIGMVEVGKIVVGRDAEGVVFISGINDTHGKVKFDMTVGRDMTVYALNSSEPCSPAEASLIYTRAWVDAVKVFLVDILTSQHVDTQKDKQQGGNQQRGGNGGGYNKGGYNKGGNGGGYNKGNYGGNGGGGNYNNGGNSGYNNQGGGNNGGYSNQQNNSDMDFLP